MPGEPGSAALIMRVAGLGDRTFARLVREQGRTPTRVPSKGAVDQPVEPVSGT
jgi:hypothetical protein